MSAFMKARASLDGSDSVTWFAGNVHSMTPDGGHEVLFGFEGYNIARASLRDGVWEQLTREAVMYLDPVSREIVERWTNPFTGEEVDVVHIWNDPVNIRIPEAVLDATPSTDLGDLVCFNMDIFLAYPSPLPRAEYPENSQDDLYKAAELFQFFVPRKELDDDSVVSASCTVAWTRIAPWLPFMGMGDRPGQLVYQGRGRKLPGGYAELPARIRTYVESRHPEYATAPREFTTPNETSWTYFRKLSGG